MGTSFKLHSMLKKIIPQRMSHFTYIDLIVRGNELLLKVKLTAGTVHITMHGRDWNIVCVIIEEDGWKQY